MATGPQQHVHLAPGDIEGLILVGWIALWQPVDLLLFERWPPVRGQRAYRCIHDTNLTIRAAA